MFLSICYNTTYLDKHTTNESELREGAPYAAK